MVLPVIMAARGTKDLRESFGYWCQIENASPKDFDQITRYFTNFSSSFFCVQMVLPVNKAARRTKGLRDSFGNWCQIENASLKYFDQITGYFINFSSTFFCIQMVLPVNKAARRIKGLRDSFGYWCQIENASPQDINQITGYFIKIFKQFFLRLDGSASQ